MADEFFTVGADVEVTGDNDDGFGAWFDATILEVKEQEHKKFLVEYKEFVAEEGGGMHQEAVDVQHIRPCPPAVTDRFKLGDRIDARIRYCWWPATVVKVLDNNTYTVETIHTDERLEKADSSLLRHRHVWENGQWVRVTQGSTSNSEEEE